VARREVYDGPDGPERELPRGDVTEGVVRVGDTVRRPHGPGGDAVASYLDHLEAVGFDGAPRYLGRDAAGRDVLDFVAGDVPGVALPDWAATEPALASVGRLLRRLHDASTGWLPAATVMFPRDLERSAPVELPPGEPVGVFHNDVTPQNTVFRDGAAWAVVDFDLAGRTTALTDLATTAMYWVPIGDPVDHDPVFTGVDVGARLRVFLDAYRLLTERRGPFLDAAGLRFDGLYASMRWRAENLGGGWARMWSEGVGDRIARRAVWFGSHRERLLAAITAPGAGRMGT
jgi:aminoglycoside phosphotransferase (APT) family kinase protein